MNDVTFNKKATTKYLFWTFFIAYILQGIVGILYNSGLALIGQLVLAVTMFAPMIGVLLSGQGLKGMGWKPHLKGKIGAVIAAWLLPSLLTVIGGALYFAVFPAHFDLSGEYIKAAVGADAMEQLEAQGLTYPMYILVTFVSAVVYAPLINMLFAVGEEAGWRGFLYPQLKARFGRQKGKLIGGVIWGAWHWPVMILIGYEYGTDYVGFPIVGMLLFCVITTALGIMCDWVYERTECIWIPSLFHGAINAMGALPMMFCITDIGSNVLLGPAPIGIIAGLPMIVFAAVLVFKADRQNNNS